jgi:hypothetical protein
VQKSSLPSLSGAVDPRDTGQERTNTMITMSYEEFSGLVAQLLDGSGRQAILAAAVVGLTAAWRLIRWQSRARTERRLQAAAAAYAARELARELLPSVPLYSASKSRELIQAGAEA